MQSIVCVRMRTFPEVQAQAPPVQVDRLPHGSQFGLLYRLLICQSCTGRDMLGALLASTLCSGRHALETWHLSPASRRLRSFVSLSSLSFILWISAGNVLHTLSAV